MFTIFTCVLPYPRRTLKAEEIWLTVLSELFPNAKSTHVYFVGMCVWTLRPVFGMVYGLKKEGQGGYG